MHEMYEAVGVREAAALAGCSRAWIYKEWSAGRGPKITKLGRRTLIRRQALVEWLAQRERETARPGRKDAA